MDVNASICDLGITVYFLTTKQRSSRPVVCDSVSVRKSKWGCEVMKLRKQSITSYTQEKKVYKIIIVIRH